jgi:MarR family 2-MHQ and catechol resistance regulon transcriptional repressor
MQIKGKERMNMSSDNHSTHQSTQGNAAKSNVSLDLYIALSRASQWVNAHIDRDIRSYGLNRTEFGVLEMLYHRGPQPLQQIGGKVLMSSGNITYVIDKLEKKGLCRRRASKEDRRLIYGEITDEGSKFIEEVFPAHTICIEEATGGLTDEEKAQASILLKKLGKYAQQSYK